MTITAALRKASDHVTPLYRAGRGQWAYNTWSSGHNAWWLGNATDYYRARFLRALSLRQRAAELLGCNEDDIIKIIVADSVADADAALANAARRVRE